MFNNTKFGARPCFTVH